MFRYGPQVLAEEVERDTMENQGNYNESPDSFIGDDLDPFSDR